MQKRKNKNLDGIDREILRVLCRSRPLISSKIAQGVGLSSSGVVPRLENLKSLGIIKVSKSSGVRSFQKKINGKNKLIRIPSRVYWDLDLVKND
ncbi:MAG: winged helix-turn-helix transcriptional regulator [Candidatus Pacearchaeota archaeon]|nr:winged helix-turn-helix transcriptional regulator [Candidatus Pacearchaeota archaeon]